jgi:hypothetical protein
VWAEVRLTTAPSKDLSHGPSPASCAERSFALSCFRKLGSDHNDKQVAALLPVGSRAPTWIAHVGHEVD